MKLKFALGMIVLALAAAAIAQRSGSRAVPKFEVDPFWPKPLPNNWMLGQIGGTFVDSHDHLWITTRPRSLDDTTSMRHSILRRPTAAFHLRPLLNSIRPEMSFRDGAAQVRNMSGRTMSTASSSIIKKMSGSPETECRTPTS